LAYDTRYTQISTVLESQFRRIRDSFAVKFERKQTVRMQSILTYARTYQQIPILRRIIDDLIREHNDHIQRRIDEEPVHRDLVREIAGKCEGALQVLEDRGHLSGVDAEQHYNRIQDAKRDPVSCWNPLQRSMNVYFRHREMLDWDPTGLKQEMIASGTRLRDIEDWLKMLERAQPWRGARIVRVFGEAPEHLADADAIRRDVVVARLAHYGMSKSGFQWSDIGVT